MKTVITQTIRFLAQTIRKRTSVVLMLPATTVSHNRYHTNDTTLLVDVRDALFWTIKQNSNKFTYIKKIYGIKNRVFTSVMTLDI